MLQPGVVVLVQPGVRSSIWAIADRLAPAGNYAARRERAG
jgi:hypothetical protein